MPAAIASRRQNREALWHRPLLAALIYPLPLPSFGQLVFLPAAFTFDLSVHPTISRAVSPSGAPSRDQVERNNNFSLPPLSNSEIIEKLKNSSYPLSADRLTHQWNIRKISSCGCQPKTWNTHKWQIFERDFDRTRKLLKAIFFQAKLFIWQETSRSSAKPSFLPRSLRRRSSNSTKMKTRIFKLEETIWWEPCNTLARKNSLSLHLQEGCERISWNHGGRSNADRLSLKHTAVHQPTYQLHAEHPWIRRADVHRRSQFHDQVGFFPPIFWDPILFLFQIHPRSVGTSGRCTFAGPGSTSACTRTRATNPTTHTFAHPAPSDRRPSGSTPHRTVTDSSLAKQLPPLCPPKSIVRRSPTAGIT